jgi:hypothetical protein
MRQQDAQTTGMIFTVNDPLDDLVRSAFDPADILAIEYRHFASNGHRTVGKREESNVHVLLPEMADEVSGVQNRERADQGFHFAVSVFQTR